VSTPFDSLDSLAQRLRGWEESAVKAVPDPLGYCTVGKDWLASYVNDTEQAADFIKGVVDLCREYKWSVMIDNDGRQEDAVLVVDVLRILNEVQR